VSGLKRVDVSNVHGLMVKDDALEGSVLKFHCWTTRASDSDIERHVAFVDQNRMTPGDLVPSRRRRLLRVVV
jgi:hypothetical protein